MRCELSPTQHAILVGLLLGDGYLEFNGYRGARLQVKQSEEKREYVLWLYRHFAHITRTPPKQRTDTRQWYFGTRFFEDLEEMRNLFYTDRVKHVPQTVAELLVSPLSLAVWFMDDGKIDYREKSHYAYHIATDSFSESDVRMLQNVLKDTFGICATVYLSQCRGKWYPKIYIGKAGRDQFTKIIAPYIVPCFSYKLPPQYRNV